MAPNRFNVAEAAAHLPGLLVFTSADEAIYLDDSQTTLLLTPTLATQNASSAATRSSLEACLQKHAPAPLMDDFAAAMQTRIAE